MTSADYLAQLQALLPPGDAWTREPDAKLTRLLSALADGLARVDSRALYLLEEADWRTTDELLADWERVAGLPDACLDDQFQTVAERRRWLVSRMTARGGQSRAYFIGLAASLGYIITIEECQPFICGLSVCGDPLGGADQWSTWIVHLPTIPIQPFEAGASCCGEPLGNWTSGMLECLFQRIKPAHTTCLFSYGS